MINLSLEDGGRGDGVAVQSGGGEEGSERVIEGWEMDKGGMVVGSEWLEGVGGGGGE